MLDPCALEAMLLSYKVSKEETTRHEGRDDQVLLPHQSLLGRAHLSFMLSDVPIFDLNSHWQMRTLLQVGHVRQWIEQ